jgi:histidyl-tRNA synthetase
MSKYQAPRGTQDLYGDEIRKWHKIEALIRELTKVYGFEEIRTPEFEHTEVFAREHDSSDVINKEMYTFKDRGDRSLSLKPEGTAGLIRAVVEHKLFTLPDPPFKYYYVSPAFRYERPQKGRMRIHHQFGLEVIGDKSPYVDAEVIGVGLTLLRTLGLKDLKVMINTLGDQASREAYKQALLNHFKPSVSTLCEDCQRRYAQNPLRILDCKVDANHPALLSAPKLSDHLSPEAKSYFDRTLAILKDSGVDVEINEKLVRGLDYYTHTVFEVVSVNPEMGSQATLFGGGRYDHLVSDLGGPELSGIGFGLGIERLLVALAAEGVELIEPESIDIYCVSLDAAALDYSYHLSNVLRLHGYTCEYDVYGRSFKAQFKSVERKRAKIAILLGEQEMSKGQVVLKKLDTQEQVTVSENDILHQLDHWLNENHVCDHDHAEHNHA